VSAGQPEISQFAAVKAAGFETVVNLRIGEPEEEAATVRGLGLEYIHIPVVWLKPTEADVAAFFAVMEEREGRPIFLHCAVNMRASAFLYLYRVLRRGVNREDAEADMQEVWVPDGVWAELIEKILRQIEVGEPKTPSI
jgi:protein tyrosine phosphatase (PTP) superfamily phosphohydrolase (DUF442 family)